MGKQIIEIISIYLIELVALAAKTFVAQTPSQLPNHQLQELILKLLGHCLFFSDLNLISSYHLNPQ